ncbi:MAG: hypothetical protein DMF61_16945 [Blastocatellia bacterium AA13]|nr:MAG: hypothetical protein DMF61_16945 [Blastocatellia bacterium AA13]
MTDLLQLLPLLLRRAGDTEEARQQAAFAAWAAAVGKQLRVATAPVKLEGKTLIVAVGDSNWKTQLNKLTGQFLFRLNSILSAPLVTRIEFVINPRLIEESHHTSPEIHFRAPEKYAGALREKAQSIANPDIRDLFIRAAGKCLQRRAL